MLYAQMQDTVSTGPDTQIKETKPSLKVGKDISLALPLASWPESYAKAE